MARRIAQLLTALALLSVLLTGLPVPAAHAVPLPLHVTKLADTNDGTCDSDCSLREAIAASATSGTILFDVTGTLTLSLGELDIPHSLTITGPGSALLTIDANHGSRVFNVQAGTVTISGMTLTGGQVDETTYPPDGSGGGAILSSGDLTLDDMVITQNTVTRASCSTGCFNNLAGGGIFVAAGSLTITNSTISHNDGYAFGGGIAFSNASGSLTLTNVNIDSNYTENPAGGQDEGGGIAVPAASSVTLTNTKIRNNDTTHNGAGMWISLNVAVTITGGEFSGNDASPSGDGGAIYNYGTLQLNHVRFANNNAVNGGALLNAISVAANQSTFVGNSSGTGGAIYSTSTLAVINSTFTGNSSTGDGGAIAQQGANFGIVNDSFSGNTAVTEGGGVNLYNNVNAFILNDTFSGNSAATSGGGLHRDGTGFLHLENTILANSLAGGDCTSLAALTTDVNNLIENNDGTNPCGSPTVVSDPMLAALAYNGGPTQTMALMAGSLAIDAGSDSTCSNPTYVNNLDQRGIARPQGAHCDIGAYEAGPAVISGNAGVAGVTLGYMDGTPKTVTTDVYGNYSFYVPVGWSGTVTPFDFGYGFSPASRTYSNVSAPQTSQDYASSGLPVTGTYDDNDAGFAHTGAWVDIAIAGPFDNTLGIIANQGGTASFNFYGNGFALHYLRYPGWGNIGVYLDNSPAPLTTLNTNGPAAIPTYNSPGLVPGPHRVTFKNAGPSGLVAFDEFEIRTPYQVGAGMHDDSDAAWNYTGTWVPFVVSGPFANTLSFGATAGSSATLLFSGTGFSLTYLQYTGWGNIAVYVDGNPIPLTTLNTNGTPGLPTYDSPALTAGNHMLKLVHAGPAGAFIGTDVVSIAP